MTIVPQTDYESQNSVRLYAAPEQLLSVAESFFVGGSAKLHERFMPLYRISGAPADAARLPIEREVVAASLRDAVRDYYSLPKCAGCVRLIVHDLAENAMHLIDFEVEAYTVRRMTGERSVSGAGRIDLDHLRKRFFGGEDMLEDYLRPKIVAPVLHRERRSAKDLQDPARPPQDEINRQSRQVKLRIDPDEWTVWNYFITKSNRNRTAFLRNAVWTYIHSLFPAEAERCAEDVRRFAKKRGSSRQ